MEPINLRLSGVMTFFFNILYFQYHFTRIAEWKRTGMLSPQRVTARAQALALAGLAALGVCVLYVYSRRRRRAGFRAARFWR